MLGVQGLVRVFGERRALDDVTFEVRPGRVTGFVGGNGAGKTTAMRIIVGVLAPTAGQVTWDGRPIESEQRRSFGYMPEERGLYPNMRVHDQLVFFGRLHGMDSSTAGRRATELLERLGLGDRSGDELKALSLGNQQRVQIAAALLHRPSALVLDEPFSGLDPLAVDAMIALLRDEVTPRMPVLFSSHQLDLVERISDDLVILSAGRVVAAGAVEELQHDQEELVRLRVVGRPADEVARGVPGVQVRAVEDGAALLSPGDRPLHEVLDLVRAQAAVTEFAPVARPLSEIYREAVR